MMWTPRKVRDNSGGIVEGGGGGVWTGGDQIDGYYCKVG